MNYEEIVAEGALLAGALNTFATGYVAGRPAADNTAVAVVALSQLTKQYLTGADATARETAKAMFIACIDGEPEIIAPPSLAVRHARRWPDLQPSADTEDWLFS